jgi:hypothetical protein
MVWVRGSNIENILGFDRSPDLAIITFSVLGPYLNLKYEIFIEISTEAVSA